MLAISFIDAPIFKWELGEKRADGYLYRADLPAGAARWLKSDRPSESCLQFVCPCGCGAVHQVLCDTDAKIAAAVGWKWNGERVKPTLKPSLQLLSACRWHGFLEKGMWRLHTEPPVI